MPKRVGPLLVVFLACVWLNQSFGLRTWETVRYGVFTNPAAHVVDAARYPFIFLYRRSADEAMYYGIAAQILGQAYDHEAFALASRGRVTGVHGFGPTALPADGRWHMPWKEVPLEYPPPVLPFLLFPKLFTSTFEGYARLFGVLMGLCIVSAIALALDVVRRAGASRRSLDARWWLAAGLLLAQGALTIQRLDAVVALLMVSAVRGAARRNETELGFCAGLAGACKIVPILVVPVIVAADWSFWRTRMKRLGAWIALGFAVGFGPMFIASYEAVLDFFHYHGARGLQVESTFGVLLGAVRIVLGTTQPAAISFGSFNLDGAVPDFLAKLALPLTVVGIGTVTWLVWRAHEPEDENARIEAIACAALAATVVLWLGGKVFSPQYLTWGIPLALAIPGRRGAGAVGLAILAMTLTQVFYRGYYDLVFEQHFVGIFTVLARQAVLVVLLLFVMPTARSRISKRSSPTSTHETAPAASIYPAAGGEDRE